MLKSTSVETKTPAELALMAEAGRFLAEVHAEMAKAVVAGATTWDVDQVAAREIKARKCKAAFPATAATRPPCIPITRRPSTASRPRQRS